MTARIEKRDGEDVFVCGNVSFPVFANDMAKSAYKVDEISDSARQTILTDSHLPIEPWIPEMSRFIIMGIIQVKWYETFKGEVPPKVLKQHEDRCREYPTLLKATADRRQAATDKAAATKAKKEGKPVPTAEELEAKKLAKEAKAKEAATEKEQREADKVTKSQEKELAKAMKQAEKAAGVVTPRAPRAPRTQGPKIDRLYQLVESQKGVWGAYVGQKQIIVKAMLKLAKPVTAAQIAELCAFENSKQTALAVVTYYMNNLSREAGTVEEVAQTAPAPAAPVVETPKPEPTKPEPKKSGKKGKEVASGAATN